MANVDGAKRYLAAAGRRPEWTLWGKAQADPTADVPAHPLLCHMTDVAAVAEALLQERLPRATRTRLVSALQLPEDTATRWLVFIIALHDLGKATPPFQVKWAPAIEWLKDAGFDVAPSRDGRDHGKLGVTLAREALVEMGVGESFAHQLARAVAAHHGAFPTDHDTGRPLVRGEAGVTPVWGKAREAIVHLLAESLAVRGLPEPVPTRERDWGFFSALAGLTSVADWIGSMAEVFRYVAPPESLTDYLPRARQLAGEALSRAGFRGAAAIPMRTFEDLFGFAPRPLQVVVADIMASRAPPLCMIVEAPMGEGKTEAALFVSHALDARQSQEGTYLGLPTQATANQMFNRLSEFLTRTRPDERISLRLLHGEAVFDVRMSRLLRAVDGPGDAAGLVCEPWFLSKKRALLAPFGAGTIDQALLAVLRTKHAFVRQLGLAGKTVVFDEVHAYDTYTSTLLDRLVAWLGALGATVVMLSATLPSSRRRKLLEAYAGGRSLEHPPPSTYPRVSWVDREGLHAAPVTTNRPSITVRLEWLDDDTDRVAELATSLAANGANVGVIRNSVRRAQDLFRRIRASARAGTLADGIPTMLLHARFPVEDRSKLEDLLLARLGKGGARPQGMIVVGTQVLEQSLDIDFDSLITDLAPVDLLLQRAGRLHRHGGRKRASCASTPMLHVVTPRGEAASANIADVAYVYERYLVRRTLLALQGVATFTLPNDIEGLVETVYENPERPEWEAALESERLVLQVGRDGDEVLARTRAWRPPTVPDDPFADLEMPYTEDDAGVARMLRAATRLGEASTELVCLFGSTESAFLDRSHTRRVDLASPASAATVRALAQRTVRVSTRGLVQAIEALPTPPAWSDVSLLARRRPIFFGVEPVTVERHDLQLDDALGLIIEPGRGSRDAVQSDD